MDTLALLRSNALFEGLRDDDLVVLSHSLQQRQFAAGETIFNQGDVGHAMYLVQSGDVNIHIAGESRDRITLKDIAAGEFFGELALFDEKPRSASARAIGPTILLELRHATLEAFLEQRPHAGIAMLRMLSQRLRETNALLSMRAARNVDAELDRSRSWSERLADVVAELNGSWKFILLIVSTTTLWCLVNSGGTSGLAFDPYPYQLFNLALAILVALQGPLIVMSQNRQSHKDRARADTDFKVNLKNELNIEILLREVNALRNESSRRNADRTGMS